MTRVVINNCHGGFSLSPKALAEYKNRAGVTDKLWDREIPRDDEHLVAIVLTMGEEADGGCAELKVVSIPDDVEWQIEEYDGLEWVAEKHRTWR